MLLDFYNSPKTYYKGYESFCYQNCLRLILEANKLPYPSLYINSALSLIIDFELNESKFDFKYHKDSRGFLTEHANKVKRYYYDLKDDSSEIFTNNIEKINETGSPIIVGVDVFYLPYTPYYQKNHAIHTLLLCGYNECEELVYIVDWYEPWFFNGVISRKEFLLARNSECSDDGSIYSGLPILNNWAEVDCCGWNKSPRELLVATLNLTLNQYFKPSNDELVGIYALKELKESVTKLNESSYEYKLQVFKDLHRQLYSLLKRHKFFKQYLEIANEYVKSENIVGIVLYLMEIIEKWETVLMLVLKSGTIDSMKSRNKLINNLGVVIEEEKILGEKISELNKLLSGDTVD